MDVIVCGGRDWIDSEVIRLALSQLPADTVIRHGAARGADRIADEIARELGLKTWAFVAEWDRLGRGAGRVRNLAMLDTQPIPSLVLAFPTKASRGTWHTVREAKKRGIPVSVRRS